MLLLVWGEWVHVEGCYSEADEECGAAESFCVEEVTFKGVSLPLDILSEAFLEDAAAAALAYIRHDGPDPDDVRDKRADRGHDDQSIWEAA